MCAARGPMCRPSSTPWWPECWAAIVVDWPLSEREGAVLQVNGRSISLSGPPKIVVSGRPGAWEVRLQRPGFAAVERVVRLGRGEHVDLMPEWQPTALATRRARL